MDVLGEMIDNAESKWLSYQKQIMKAYNKKSVGDLVLKIAGHTRNDLVLLSLLLSGTDLISSEKPKLALPRRSFASD